MQTTNYGRNNRIIAKISILETSVKAGKEASLAI